MIQTSYTAILPYPWFSGKWRDILKGNDPTGDTPMTSMIMGGSVKSRVSRQGS